MAMKYDADIELQDIDIWPERATRGRLLHDIEKAQGMMVPETVFRNWCAHLRFVVDKRSDTETRDYSFELIESANEQEAREPFIAVSYRWSPANTGSKASCKILAPEAGRLLRKEVRPIRAPVDILLRAFSFAKANGIRKVWIDQECIHQNDAEDKRLGVQSMHLVYHWSAITLVMLGHHIKNSSDILALRHLINPEDLGQIPLRSRIKEDVWWTRAWTAHELGHSNSKQLRFLVAWHNDLDLSGQEWDKAAAEFNDQDQPVNFRQSVCRQWLLTWSDMFSIAHMMPQTPIVMMMMQSTMINGSLGPATYALTELSLDDASHRLSSLSSVMQKQDETGGSLSLTSAIRLITMKDCFIVSDKLGMLGNLANYPHRLEVDRAERRRLSFTACAIAVALYNGDLGFLFTWNPNSPWPLTFAERTVRNVATWLPDHRQNLELLAMAPTADQFFQSRQVRDNRALVLDGKLAIKGLLWENISYFTDSDLQKSMQSSIRTGERLRSLTRALFQLPNAEDNGGILEALVAIAMRRQLTSLEELDSIIKSIRRWYHNGETAEWPAVFTDSPLETIYATEQDDKEQYNDAVVDLCEDIAQGFPLMVGKCTIGQRVGDHQYAVEVHCIYQVRHDNGVRITPDSVVFSPLGSLEYEFGQNPWLHLVLNQRHWQVEEYHTQQGLPVSDKTLEKLRKRLGDQQSGTDTGALSNRVFAVKGCATIVPSPRLSSAGLFSAEKYIPIGLGAMYQWFC